MSAVTLCSIKQNEMMFTDDGMKHIGNDVDEA